MIVFLSTVIATVRYCTYHTGYVQGGGYIHSTVSKVFLSLDLERGCNTIAN